MSGGWQNVMVCLVAISSYSMWNWTSSSATPLTVDGLSLNAAPSQVVYQEGHVLSVEHPQNGLVQRFSNGAVAHFWGGPSYFLDDISGHSLQRNGRSLLTLGASRASVRAVLGPPLREDSVSFDYRTTYLIHNDGFSHYQRAALLRIYFSRSDQATNIRICDLPKV